MKRLVSLLLAVAACECALGAAPRGWRIEVQWGDSIPAGTVLSAVLDSDGHLTGERKGLPITQNGKLTAKTFERTVQPNEAASLRAEAEAAIRSADINRLQDEIIGDGGFVHINLWDGTVHLSLEIERLATRPGQAREVFALVTHLERLMLENGGR